MQRRTIETAAGDVTPLGLLWSRTVCDHVATSLATPSMHGYHRLPDIAGLFASEVGREGLVVELHILHSIVRHDTKVVTAAQVEANVGYRHEAVLGYAYIEQLAGTIPLASYFSKERCDSLLVAGSPHRCAILRRAAEIGSPYVFEAVLGHVVLPEAEMDRGLRRCVSEDTAALRIVYSVLAEVDRSKHKGRAKGNKYSGIASRYRGTTKKNVKKTPHPPSSTSMAAPLSVEAVGVPAEVMGLVMPEKVVKLDAGRQEAMVGRLHDLHREKQALRRRRLALQQRRPHDSQRLSLAEEKESIERLYYEDNRRSSETAYRLTQEHIAGPPQKKLTRFAQSDFNRRLAEEAEAKKVRRQQRLEALCPLGPPSGTPVRPRSWLELHAGELHTNVVFTDRTPRPPSRE